MMDALDIAWVSIFFLFAMTAVIFGMWYMVPKNKAYILRRLRGKNYIVVTLRHGGGQLKEYVKRVEAKKNEDKMPTVTINDREYVPIEKVTRRETVVGKDGESIEREVTDSIVNFYGSVPVYFYNYDDIKPVALSGVDVEQKFRNPALLNSIFMQVQALYRTRVAKEIAALMKTVNSWDLRIWAILGGVMLILVLSALNYMQGQSTQNTVIQVGSILNQSFSNALQNQLPH